MLTGESVTSIIRNNQPLPSNRVCVCARACVRACVCVCARAHVIGSLSLSNNAMKSNTELFIPRWYTLASGLKKKKKEWQNNP